MALDKDWNRTPAARRRRPAGAQGRALAGAPGPRLDVAAGRPPGRADDGLVAWPRRAGGSGQAVIADRGRDRPARQGR